MRGVDGGVAILNDEHAIVVREFDTNRSFAVPNWLDSPVRLAAQGRCACTASRRHVVEAVFVLIAVAADVGKAQAVVVDAAAPDVVEHVLEAIVGGDALHDAARGRTVDDAGQFFGFDVQHLLDGGSGALFQRVFVFFAAASRWRG